MLASTGCGAIAESEQPTPTVVPVRDDEGKQTYEARRGSIFDTIKGLGRIVAQEELPLYFKQSGRILSLHVETLQPVKKGDLLAELDPGNLPTKIEEARIAAEIAQLEMSKLVADNDDLPPEVASAASSVVAAEAAAIRASNDLLKLESGARPADIAAAEADVNAARAQLGTAESRLAALKRPPNGDEVIAAQAALDKARAALQKAQAEYDKIAWQANAAGTPQALALQRATADFEEAQANLNLKKQAARPEDIAAAERAVQSAQSNLQSAESMLAQVRSGSRGEDIAAARVSVQQSEQALAAVRAAYDATVASSELDLSSYDVALAQKEVDLARAKFDGLQEELELTRIRAPFDGVITFVTGTKGEQFEAFAPLMILSDPSVLEVSVEFDGTTLTKVSNGQEAVVTTEAFGDQEIKGKVVRVPGDLAASKGPTAPVNMRAIRIRIEPPGPGIQLGQLAQATIIVQRKDDIILIPNTAVRRFGSRLYVQVLGEDGRRRDQTIKIGLVTETETEITEGLQEGQLVIVQ